MNLHISCMWTCYAYSFKREYLKVFYIKMPAVSSRIKFNIYFNDKRKRQVLKFSNGLWHSYISLFILYQQWLLWHFFNKLHLKEALQCHNETLLKSSASTAILTVTMLGLSCNIVSFKSISILTNTTLHVYVL